MLFFIAGVISLLISAALFGHVGVDESALALIPGYLMLVAGAAFATIGLFRIGRFALRLARPSVIRLDIALPGGPVRTVVQPRRRY